MKFYKPTVLIKTISGCLAILLTLSIFLTTGFRHSHNKGNAPHEHAGNSHRHIHDHKVQTDNQHSAVIPDKNSHIHTTILGFSITLPDIIGSRADGNISVATQNGSQASGQQIPLTDSFTLFHMVFSFLSAGGPVPERLQLEHDPPTLFLKHQISSKIDQNRDAPDTPPPEV